MNFLITGATGYLGRNFLDSVKLDENKYFFLVRSKKKILTKNIYKNIKFVFCDLQNFKKLKNILNGLQIDVLINFAWIGATNKYKDSKIQKNNFLILKNLAKLGIHLKIKKFIGFGSQAEYGIINKKINERMICKPLTKYGKTKLKSYKILKNYFKKKNIKFIWIRLFSSFGPHDDENFLIPYLIKNFLKNENIYLTKCEQKWDFIYSKDVIKATKFLAHSKKANGKYNLGSGSVQNLKSVVLKIKKITLSKSKVFFGALKYNKNQIMYLHADINKLKKLGWRNKSNFTNEIKELVKFNN